MKAGLGWLAMLGASMVLPVCGIAEDGPSLTGTYAVLLQSRQSDSFGETGGAILSVLQFDGAGAISGTAVLKVRTGDLSEGGTGSGSVRGTYTIGADGMGRVDLEFPEFQYSVKLAVVITGGGKRILLVDAPGNSGFFALNPTLHGAEEKVTGALPGGYFLQSFRPGAKTKGTIPVTLTRTYNDGVAIYSLGEPATSGGEVTCPDGSAGDWLVTIPSLTAVMENNSGNFLMSVRAAGCGGDEIKNFSGLANLFFTPDGINLVLHLTDGLLITGSGRAADGTSPQGVYGVQLTGEPFPNAALQVLTFDGSGGITATGISGGGEAAFSGTYTTNPDGTGVITMTPEANPSAAPATFFYAIAGEGDTIYTLRTSGGGGGADVVVGTGHHQ
ncbi:MAG: hypothetical protein IANPNBLG_00082 [Bryobacteraceae bacterium]|nr:hypothetical protein [Bryobacteraceae bacterium]